MDERARKPIWATYLRGISGPAAGTVGLFRSGVGSRVLDPRPHRDIFLVEYSSNRTRFCRPLVLRPRFLPSNISCSICAIILPFGSKAGRLAPLWRLVVRRLHYSFSSVTGATVHRVSIQ